MVTKCELEPNGLQPWGGVYLRPSSSSYLQHRVHLEHLATRISPVAGRAERRKGTKEPGACVNLFGECHPLAMIACSGNRTTWHTTPRSQADVTVRTFSVATVKVPHEDDVRFYTADNNVHGSK